MSSTYGVGKYGSGVYGSEDTVRSLAKRPRMRVYRDVLMKRRELDGEYETDWQTIPSVYIKKYGSVSHGVSDLLANFYKYSGFNVELSNLDGYFNDIDDDQSFFYEKLSVYKTLVRVDAGYIDDFDVRTPTNGTLFIGIVGEGIQWTEDRSLNLQCDHISRIFDEFPADRISGLGTTQTASDIITKVRDHIDSNGVAIFQKYISSGAWFVDTTTTQYDMATSAALSNKSVWAVMKDLATSENRSLYISPDGSFYFQDRATPSTISWHYSGTNDTDNSFGKSVYSVKVDEKIRNVYNRSRVKFDKADTNTSYKTIEETWNWGDDSSSFKFGVRTYNYTNLFLNSATASTVAQAVFDQFQFPTTEAKIRGKFLPQLAIGDLTTLTHKNGVFSGPDEYGEGVYGTAVFGQFKKGSVDLLEAQFKPSHISHTLENFATVVTLDSI